MNTIVAFNTQWKCSFVFILIGLMYIFTSTFECNKVAFTFRLKWKRSFGPCLASRLSKSCVMCETLKHPNKWNWIWNWKIHWNWQVMASHDLHFNFKRKMNLTVCIVYVTVSYNLALQKTTNCKVLTKLWKWTMRMLCGCGHIKY